MVWFGSVRFGLVQTNLPVHSMWKRRQWTAGALWPCPRSDTGGRWRILRNYVRNVSHFCARRRKMAPAERRSVASGNASLGRRRRTGNVYDRGRRLNQDRLNLNGVAGVGADFCPAPSTRSNGEWRHHSMSHLGWTHGAARSLRKPPIDSPNSLDKNVHSICSKFQNLHFIFSPTVYHFNCSRQIVKIWINYNL